MRSKLLNLLLKNACTGIDLVLESPYNVDVHLRQAVL